MLDYHDRRHLSEIRKLIKEIERHYLKAGNEISKIGAIVTRTGQPFDMDKATNYKKVFKAIFQEMANGIENTILSSVNAEWFSGEVKAVETIAKQLKGKISTEALNKLKEMNFGSTHGAKAAFNKRISKKLNLSKRVWKYADDYKRNLELIVNIEGGKSAHDIALEIQKFLRQPDNLFRRVRDDWDNLKLSLPASQFHPGKGVYRSSYKNALRLARTETNMAYRRAENARYQSLPFVVGFEVRLSDSHPCYDICDELQGFYPKDFIFDGWHPNCLCYTTSVLSTDVEYEDLEMAILNGEEIPYVSKNTVKDVPKGFHNWVNRNTGRAAGWKNQPYFIQNNFKGGKLDGGLNFAKPSQKD